MSAVNQEPTQQELLYGSWSFKLGPTGMSYSGTYYIKSVKNLNGQTEEKKVKHGKGVLTWDDGREYSGDFANDQLHGTGTMCWPTGEKYIGTYVKNDKSGLGKLLFPDTSMIEGVWYEGKRHGVFFCYDPRCGHCKMVFQADAVVSTEFIRAPCDYSFQPDYHIFGKSEGSESTEDESTCTICFGGLCKGDTCIRTACNHVFHKECMDTWMERKFECPLCRQKIEPHRLCVTIVPQEATCPAPAKDCIYRRLTRASGFYQYQV
jgi:hypothetical protein